MSSKTRPSRMATIVWRLALPAPTSLSNEALALVLTGFPSLPKVEESSSRIF